MSAEGVKQSVVEFAAQTGRLDFLSAAIAVLALAIGLAAFPLFFFVRNRAEVVAREATEAALADAVSRVENEAVAHIERILPTLIEEYHELAHNAVRADIADQIAAAQGDGNDDNQN